jgi:hypothetical protein
METETPSMVVRAIATSNRGGIARLLASLVSDLSIVVTDAFSQVNNATWEPRTAEVLGAIPTACFNPVGFARGTPAVKYLSAVMAL